MTGAHALMVASRLTVINGPKPKHSGGIVHDIFGWLIVAVVVFVIVKFVKGQRNKAQSAAEAWAGAVAKAAAEASASASASGGDARSAIQLNVGAGQQTGDDQYAYRVACLVVAMLRAELPGGQWDDYQHVGAELSSNARSRYGLDAAGSARGPLSAGAPIGRVADREPAQVTA